MTGFVAGPPNPLSRLTVASLKDLGYVVDMTKAERYTLPNLLRMAEDGVLASTHDHDGMVIPTVPMTLPDDSLQP